MSQLLLISLGPIQDFITSARRCQDLWFGSWLLSELARTTAAAVGQTGTVIFPASETELGGADRPGVANKILARLPTGVAAAVVAADARRAQQARLHEIAEAAWRSVPATFFHGETARLQVDELMEFQWVSVSEEDRPYADARAELEARLAAVKNTRLWGQPAWQRPTGIPKSSLDGDRECVIDETVYDWTPDRRRGSFGVKGKERLCGIGLLKRLGADDAAAPIFNTGRPTFHSTAHVATIPLLERIARHPDGATASRGYLDRLRELGLRLDRFRLQQQGPTLLGHDGVLLLESRLPEHFAEAGSAAPDAPVHAAAALAALRREVGGGEPCPYYAFLLADGDQMGRAIDSLAALGHHQELARALDGFSVRCRAIVEHYRGTLIFAGGDDVLALLPLHRGLACARELARMFEHAVQPVVARHWGGRQSTDDMPTTTLSVGIAITHLREPMSEARRLAKAAETEAKKLRNALAIKVAKRSGADLTLSGRWNEDPPLDARLDVWLRVLDAGELSSKTAHDLERLAAMYDAPGPPRSDEVISLARGLLRRKRQRGGDSDAPTEALVKRLHADRPTEQLRAMSNELQLARLLLRAHRNATDAMELP